MKMGGKAAGATGKGLGEAVLHPAKTIRGAGKTVKVATASAAAGYIGWEKLTTDKSVVRIVGDAIVGENTTDAIGKTVDAAGAKMSELTGRAEQAIEGVNRTTASLSSSLGGISNFIGGISGGNAGNMLGNFFGNLAGGKVSGMSIVGLIAGAFLVFGRFGWLGKIAGALLTMMLVGNNSDLRHESTVTETARQEPSREEEQSRGGMRR